MAANTGNDRRTGSADFDVVAPSDDPQKQAALASPKPNGRYVVTAESAPAVASRVTDSVDVDSVPENAADLSQWRDATPSGAGCTFFHVPEAKRGTLIGLGGAAAVDALELLDQISRDVGFVVE